MYHQRLARGCTLHVYGLVPAVPRLVGAAEPDERRETSRNTDPKS